MMYTQGPGQGDCWTHALYNPPGQQGLLPANMQAYPHLQHQQPGQQWGQQHQQQGTQLGMQQPIQQQQYMHNTQLGMQQPVQQQQQQQYMQDMQSGMQQPVQQPQYMQVLQSGMFQQQRYMQYMQPGMIQQLQQQPHMQILMMNGWLFARDLRSGVVVPLSGQGQQSLQHGSAHSGPSPGLQTPAAPRPTTPQPSPSLHAAGQGVVNPSAVSVLAACAGDPAHQLASYTTPTASQPLQYPLQQQPPLQQQQQQQPQQQQEPAAKTPPPMHHDNAACMPTTPSPPAQAAAAPAAHKGTGAKSAALPEEFLDLSLLGKAGEQRLRQLFKDHSGFLQSEAGCDAAAAMMRRIIAIELLKHHDDVKKLQSMLKHREGRDKLMEVLVQLEPLARCAARKQVQSPAGVSSIVGMAQAAVQFKDIGGTTGLLTQCCTTATAFLRNPAHWTMLLLRRFVTLCRTAGHRLYGDSCRNVQLAAAAAVKADAAKCAWDTEQLIQDLRKIMVIVTSPGTQQDRQMFGFSALDAAVSEEVLEGGYCLVPGLKALTALAKACFMPHRTAEAASQCIERMMEQQQQKAMDEQQQQQQQQGEVIQEQQQQQSDPLPFRVAAHGAFALTSIGALQHRRLPELLSSMANLPSSFDSDNMDAAAHGLHAFGRLPLDLLSKHKGTLQKVGGYVAAGRRAGWYPSDAQWCQLHQFQTTAGVAGVHLAQKGGSQQQQHTGGEGEERPAKRARLSTPPSPAAAAAQQLGQEPRQPTTQGSSGAGGGGSSSSSSSGGTASDLTPPGPEWSEEEIRELVDLLMELQQGGLRGVLTEEDFRTMVTCRVRSLQPRGQPSTTQTSTIADVRDLLLHGYSDVTIGDERLVAGPWCLVTSVDGLVKCGDRYLIVEVDGHASHFLMAPVQVAADLRKLGIAEPERGEGDGNILFYPSGATLARNSTLHNHGHALLVLHGRNLQRAKTQAAVTNFLEQEGVHAGSKRKART